MEISGISSLTFCFDTYGAVAATAVEESLVRNNYQWNLKMELLTVLKNSPSYALQLHLLIRSNLYLHSPRNVKCEDPGFKGTPLFNRINQHTTFSTKITLRGSGNAQDWAFKGRFMMLQTCEQTHRIKCLAPNSVCLFSTGWARHSALRDREKMTLLLPGGFHAEMSQTQW